MLLPKPARLYMMRQCSYMNVLVGTAWTTISKKFSSMADWTEVKGKSVDGMSICTSRPRCSMQVCTSTLYIHVQLLTLNIDQPKGEKKKIGELTPALRETWSKMTSEEKLAVTQDGAAKLSEKREMKLLAKQNIPINAFNDTRANLDKLEREVG